jgi:phytoene/squalene synthetase
VDQRALYDKVALSTSKLTTSAYSTSFSLGIRCLARELRAPIYSIYGFVRFADEIVDTLHDYDQQTLLSRFKADTFTAIREGISINPVLQSFQNAVNRYGISLDLIESFFQSMETDLIQKQHSQETFDRYVLGSAETVGLMCLHVFCANDAGAQQGLKPFAMKLGSAFQKVNFLRDLNADINGLGRRYFPELTEGPLTIEKKKKIESLIHLEFAAALPGIRQLPRSSRLGVYVAYLYFKALLQKIIHTTPEAVLRGRITVPKPRKVSLLVYSYLKHQFNLI